MLGLTRRKKVEGWAIDVPEGDGEMERQSALRRFADNNRIWIACLIGIVLLTFALIKFSSKTIGGYVPDVKPLQAPAEFRDLAAYEQFAYEFRTDKRFGESVETARFLAPGRFQIVVASGVGADEIDYVAKMAAERVRYKFRHRTVVQVYKRESAEGTKELVATAQWEPKKGGYSVTLQPIPVPSQ